MTKIPKQLAWEADDLLLVGTVVLAPAREDDVEQPIAIEVDQSNTAAERFENGVMIGDFFAVAVAEGDARSWP